MLSLFPFFQKECDCYLQTAEDGKQIVEGHDITVNSH